MKQDSVHGTRYNLYRANVLPGTVPYTFADDACMSHSENEKGQRATIKRFQSHIYNINGSGVVSVVLCTRV